MKIISIDVGIKNLAFCLLQIEDTDPNKKFQIIKWDVINVGEEETLNCQYINCNKPAKFKKTECYFCLKHSKTSSYKIPPTELKPSNINKHKLNKLFELADKYGVQYSKPIKKIELLTLLKSYINITYLDPIINIDASKINLVTIGRNIYTKMNDLFYSSDNHNNEPITHVIIENQISPIANRMKTIQGMIAQYFIMNNVKTIEFISASNKLKGCINSDDDDVTADISTYTNRKKKGVLICLELLKNTNLSMLKQFELHKKKDD